MRSFPLVLVIVLTVFVCVIFCVPNRPPSIYVQAPHDVYYKAGESVEIQCIADAVPDPQYNWTRNERPFNPSGNDDRMAMLKNSGTIVMNKPLDKDEGIFQCIAYNHLGASLSINVNFRQAMLEDFPYRKDQVITVQRGHSVRLMCTPPTSIPKADITWHIRDKSGGTKAINLDNRITQDLEGRLYITNVQIEDYQNGNAYVCIAINYFMRKNSISHGTIIQPTGGSSENVPPQYLWSTPNEIFGVLGEPLRIKCIFGGNPTPQVHWENKTGSIPDNRRSLSLGGQELFISELRDIDRGSYTCYTTSAMGQRQQRNINVIIKARPYWLEGGEPKDIETSVGAKATFICKAGGDPTPVIQWYINGQRLKDSKHVTVREGRLLKRDDNNVTVIDLRKTDAMVLQCNASNVYGYVFADFYLNVLEEAPAFIRGPDKELIVAENTDVRLICQTSGKPDPIITWFKGKQQITGGRYQIQPNGDLLIRNLVLSDAGNFTCTAENQFGSVSDWGVMVVRRSTRIEQHPSDLEVNALTDAKFTCSGTTDFEEVENLRVYWLKDRKEITNSNQRMTTNVQDNSLTISGTISRDSGFYTCVVTNGLDQQNSSAILTVKDRPEHPVDVHTKDCLNNSVKLTWTKGGFNNAPIQYFTVEYNTSMEPESWQYVATANQSDNTITLTLRPGVSYSFRLIAINKIGMSEPSKHSETCTTDTAKPYKNPENVRGIGDKPGYLVIEWTPMPPIDHGGKNFRYILKISKAGNVPLNDVRTLANWRQNRIEYLTNDIYTPYNVSIQAANEHDNSAAKLETYVIYSAESKPNTGVRVENFVVDNTAMQDNAAVLYWTWDNNMESQLNGKFRGFKIQYWVKNMKYQTFREDEILEKDLKPRYGSVNKRSAIDYTYTIQNLLPYTYMEAQICVMNTYYVSGPSALVSFITSRGVPGPVENLQPKVISSNFIELTWEAPELLNSPNDSTYLQGYDVAFQSVNGLEMGKMQEMDPQVTDPRLRSAVLNGLTAKTRYRIHMWARTENGRGEDSFIEVTTAAASGMDVPTFNIKNVNQTFFNLTWTMVISKKYGTVAFVEYRIKGTSDWQQSPQEVSKSWIGIGDLDHGRSYEVRLAVTNGGKTSKSNIEIVKTSGLSFAFSLGGNFGWFIGLIVSMLIVIAIACLIVLKYKNLPPEEERPRYKAPPRKRSRFDDDRSTRDIVQKSSGSLNKGYDNYTYSDKDYPDDEYNGRFRDYHDDNRDYNRAYRDDDDDEYKRRYNEDETERYDDRYDRRRSDEYDDRSYDRYDRRRDDAAREHNDDYDKQRYYGDKEKRYSDEYDRYDNGQRRYSSHSDEEQSSEARAYRPSPPHPSYDRSASYDKRPPSVDEDDDDLREPAKFDADGYPINSRPDTGKSPGKSSFV